MSTEKIKINKIVRSNRKTIALIITQEATLIVRAPLYTSQQYIDYLVNKKSNWIKIKLEEARKKPKTKAKEFVTGEHFLYLGKHYPLRFTERIQHNIILKDCCFYISKNLSSTTRDLFISWYKKEAKKKISERCKWFTKTTGYKPVSIKISDAQKRLGSCGPNGNINFSWRLIMGPMNIIDYVIVHELVHLEEKNHSKVFWNKVRSILPDYEKRQIWLKENSTRLQL